MHKLFATLALTLATPFAQASEPADEFMAALHSLCGKAFAGQLLEYNESDIELLGQAMVMHVRE